MILLPVIINQANDLTVALRLKEAIMSAVALHCSLYECNKTVSSEIVPTWASMLGAIYAVDILGILTELGRHLVTHIIGTWVKAREPDN